MSFICGLEYKGWNTSAVSLFSFSELFLVVTRLPQLRRDTRSGCSAGCRTRIPYTTSNHAKFVGIAAGDLYGAKRTEVMSTTSSSAKLDNCLLNAFASHPLQW